MPDAVHKQRVYIACRPIFSGHHSNVRKRKKIKELIDAAQQSLASLLNDLGEKNLIKIVRELLDKGIFSSETRAKIEFPELFSASSSRDTQHQNSEIEAALAVAEALEGIESQEEDIQTAEDALDGGVEVAPNEQGPQETAPRHKVAIDTDKSLNTARDQSANKSFPEDSIPSLYPSYFPYKTQHLILNTVQRVLEEGCFEYAIKSMPHILQRKKWQCPEAGELTEWAKVFRSYSKPYLASRAEILEDIANIRHAAVHRLPMTARVVGTLLESAVKFTRALEDELRASRLEELQLDIVSKIQAMELNKNVLENGMICSFVDIQRRREELDKMERDLFAGVLKNDAENSAFIGQLLESSLEVIFHGNRSDNRRMTAMGGEAVGGGMENEDEDEEDQDEDGGGPGSRLEKGKDIEVFVRVDEDDDEADQFVDAEM